MTTMTDPFRQAARDFLSSDGNAFREAAREFLGQDRGGLARALGAATASAAAGVVEGAAIQGGQAAKFGPSVGKMFASSLIASAGQKLADPIGVPGVGVDTPLEQIGYAGMIQAANEADAREPLRAQIVGTSLEAGDAIRGLGPDYERSPGLRGLAEDVVGAVPQLAAAGLAGVGGAALTGGNPVGGMLAGAGAFAAMDAGSTTSDIYRRLIAEGVPPQEAASRAAMAGQVYGAASGVLEFAGVGAVLKKTPLKRYMGKAAEGLVGRIAAGGGRAVLAGGEEGLTEAAQGVVADAASAWAADDWEGFRSSWADMDTRGREFLVGAILGGAVRGGIEGVDLARYRSVDELRAELAPEARSPETAVPQAPPAQAAAPVAPAAETALSESPTPLPPQSLPASPEPTAPRRTVGENLPPQPDQVLDDGTAIFRDGGAAAGFVQFRNQRREPGAPPLRAVEVMPGAFGSPWAVVPDTMLHAAQERAAAQTADVDGFTRDALAGGQGQSRSANLLRRQTNQRPGTGDMPQRPASPGAPQSPPASSPASPRQVVAAPLGSGGTGASPRSTVATARRPTGEAGRTPAQSASSPEPAPAAQTASTPTAPAPPATAVESRPSESPQRHEFSSTQINLTGEVADRVNSIAGSIPDEDLAGDGRETQPHITVKYGLHTEDVDEVRRVVEGFGPLRVQLGKTSTFPPSESSDGADVVKVDVMGADLRRLNKAIGDALEATDTHPVYKPHVTLAYVKAGLGEKYAGRDNLAGTKLTIDRIVFSDRDGKQHEISLGVKPAPRPGESVKPAEQPGGTVKPEPDRLPVNQMTRDQLLAEAESLGVADGPKSKPALAKRVQAARGTAVESGRNPLDPDTAAGAKNAPGDSDAPVETVESGASSGFDPEPIAVGDRLTMPEHTGAQGEGRNYGNIRDAEVVRVTPKFVVVRQTNSPENAAIFGETTTTRIPKTEAVKGTVTRGAPAEQKGSPISDRPESGIARTLWDVANDMERKAKERIKGRQIPRGRGTGATTLPQDFFDAVVVVGAAKILKGAARFGQWSGAMVEDFGEDIRPHLRELWGESRARARAIQGRPSDTRRVVKETTGQTDISPAIETTEARALKAKLTTEERAARKAYRAAEREGRATLRARLTAAREQSRAAMLAAVRETRGKEQARAQARAEVIEGLRKEARRLIEEHLPLDARGAFLADLTGPQTFGGLARTIGKITNTIERLEHRDAVSDLRRSIGRARKAKLRPEFERFIDDKFGDLDVTAMSAKTRRALQATAEFLENNPEAPVPASVIERVKRLNKRSVAEMGPDEIRAAADAIDMAVHLSKLKNELIGRQRGRRREAVAAKAIGEMEARAPKLKSDPGLVARLRGRPTEGPRRGAVSKFFREGGTRPEVLLEHLSPELRELVWEDIGVHAHHDENTLIWEFRDGLRDALDAVDLPMQRRDGVQKWRDAPVEIPGGPTLTRGEALWVHLTLRDPSNAALAWRNGLTIARLDETVRLSPGLLDAVETAIGEQGRKIADHMFGQFNGRMKEALNAAWVDVYGVEVATNDQYVPRRIDMTRADSQMDAMEQMAMDLEATLTSWGHLRQRVGAAAPLQIGDAFDAFISHIDHVSRLGAYLAPTANSYAILGRSEVKRAIIDRVGKVGYDRILAAIHMQTVRTADRSEGARWMRRAMRRVGGGILGLRVSTMLLNPAGIPISVAYLPNGFKLLAQALPSSAGALKTTRSRIGKKLREHSPYWRTRYEDFAHQTTAGIGSRRAELGGPGLTELALKPLAWTDEFGGVIRGRIAELHVQQNLGMQESDADYWPTVAREWERMMFRGENTGHGMELSGVLAEGRRNPYWAPFVAFSSSVSKVYSLAVRGTLAGRRAKRLLAAGDRAGAVREARAALAAAGSVAASAAWAAMIREVLSSDREDDDRTLAQRGLERVTLEMASAVPVLGPNVAVPAIRAALGDRGPTYSASLTDAMLMDTAGAISDVVGAVASWRSEETNAAGEAAWVRKAARAADGMADLAGTFTGLPYSGGSDIVRRTGLLENLDPDASGELRKLLADQDSMPSVTGERRIVLRSLLEEDDQMFRRAMERWHRARPGEPIRVSDLRDVIDDRYKPLLRIQSKGIELNDTQREYLDEVRAEYGELVTRLGAMVARHRDLLGVRRVASAR